MKLSVTRERFAEMKEVEFLAAKGELSWDAYCINQLGCKPYTKYEVVVIAALGGGEGKGGGIK